MASAFMSYTGPFNKNFRDKLCQESFVQDLRERNIPHSKSLNLLELLTNDAERGEWNLQGLPTDDLSVQNGILTTRASRYPLMVDPQGQGLSWTRVKEAPNGLQETSTTDKGFRNVLEDCLAYGKPLLLSNVEEEIDPVLDPVLDKAFIRQDLNSKL
jgi:dynein heavy chain